MAILPDSDLPFDASMLDRLAMVSIRVGLNLQEGQDLIITGPVEALPLIRRISAEAYKNGAGVVSTILTDDELQLTRYEHATDESLDRAPDWMFKAAYTKDTEWNDTAWRGTKASKRFNELVVAAASETDQAVRRTKYFEAQELLHDDGGVILPMFANYIMAHTKKLAHEPNVAANWEMDGNRLAERWWFA